MPRDYGNDGGDTTNVVPKKSTPSIPQTSGVNAQPIVVSKLFNQQQQPKYDYSSSSSFTYGQGNPLYQPTLPKTPSPKTPPPKSSDAQPYDVQRILDELDLIRKNATKLSSTVVSNPDVAFKGDTAFKGSSIVASSGITYVEPTPPTPTPISSIVIAPPPPPVKTATLDIILFEEDATPIDIMENLILENIGGQELISITRSDIVNGQKISYQPIKNLSSIQQRYNPNNILSLQQTSDKYFSGFPIKLEQKIPNEGNGPNGKNVYLNNLGDLIIEFVNINNDEQVEVQITVNGTIYEIDLGDTIS